MHNQGLSSATLTALRPETSSEKPTLGTAMNVRTWATSLNSCACTRVMLRAHHHKASPIAAAATVPMWLSQCTLLPSTHAHAPVLQLAAAVEVLELGADR